VRLAARIYQMTMVEFRRKVAPPWRNGNCFALASEDSWEAVQHPGGAMAPERGEPHWLVLNMHAENFRALVEDAGLREIELEVVKEHYCLITDRRVNRGWIRSAPCHVCVPKELRAWLERERRELFRATGEHKPCSEGS
jgi:hypothetical protein